MRKWFLISLLIIVLAIGATGVVFATSNSARQWARSLMPQPTPEAVRVEPVTRGPLIRLVNAPGSIEPRTKVQISAQVAARITELPFRENQTVRKNDVVVKLDSRDLAAALESAQANLRAEESRLSGADARMKQSFLDLQRLRVLHEGGDRSRAELESAESNYLSAKSSFDATRNNIDAARAQIDRATKDLENTTIIAPFDGTIVKLNAEVGELVLVGTLNNAASVIMEIADLSTMIMKARVDEANIGPVKQGQTARIFINAFPNRSFAGTVEKVGLKRQVDRDGTGYFEVEVLVQKPDDLLLASGLTANVDIEVEKFENVLKIPSQSVVDRRIDELPRATAENPVIDRAKAFTSVVYVIRDGKARSVPVKIGPSDLTHTNILAGLDEGDKIITGPFRILTALKDDSPVRDDSLPDPDSGSSTRKSRRSSDPEPPPDDDEAEDFE